MLTQTSPQRCIAYIYCDNTIYEFKPLADVDEWRSLPVMELRARAEHQLGQDTSRYSHRSRLAANNEDLRVRFFNPLIKLDEWVFLPVPEGRERISDSQD